jgi:hypothetical protein
MRRPLASLVAVFLAAILAGATALESFHNHASWQRDLRSYELSRVDSSAVCPSTAHWDSGSSKLQPACPACLAAASSVGFSLPVRAPAPALTSFEQPAFELASARDRSPLGRRSGRAPPALESSMV